MKSFRYSILPYLVFLCFSYLFCFSSAASGSEQQVQYFPQFADGDGYITSWYFTGYGSGPSTIDVEFFDKTYHRLSLATDQGTNNTFHLSLNGYGSVSLRTLGLSSPQKSGWVKITSSPSVGAMETFETIGSNNLISKASVLASGATVSATLLVPDPGRTAIAITSAGYSNTLTFRLLDNNGNIVGTTSNFSLPAGNQLAIFVKQIPGFEKLSVTNGSLELTGSVAFYLTTLVFDGQNFATAPVLPGRSEPADARGILLNQFTSIQQQSKIIADQLLPPSTEDLSAFAAFLSQPQTGLMRLMPRETYDGYLTIRGGGAYYSFARVTHEYGYGSDIGLEQGYLSVGFAGADFGFLTNLGDVPIDGISLDTPAVQYLATFSPPTNLADARVQQQRAGTGFTSGGYYYVDDMRATASTTFAVRSICYNASDVLVAFRVVRFDTDGSAIVAWKILQKLAVPKLQ
jgi:hypothetical protein